MSKGLGKIEKLILEALKRRGTRLFISEVGISACGIAATPGEMPVSKEHHLMIKMGERSRQ